MAHIFETLRNTLDVRDNPQHQDHYPVLFDKHASSFNHSNYQTYVCMSYVRRPEMLIDYLELKGLIKSTKETFNKHMVTNTNTVTDEMVLSYGQADKHQ